MVMAAQLELVNELQQRDCGYHSSSQRHVAAPELSLQNTPATNITTARLYVITNKSSLHSRTKDADD